MGCLTPRTALRCCALIVTAVGTRLCASRSSVSDDPDLGRAADEDVAPRGAWPSRPRRSCARGERVAALGQVLVDRRLRHPIRVIGGVYFARQTASVAEIAGEQRRCSIEACA